MFEKFYVNAINSDEKIDTDRHFCLMAGLVSMQSPCIRRKYGAVIVKDDRVISVGCNTFPKEIKTVCTKDDCIREQGNLPHGKGYQGTCNVIHAEVNAIINADPTDLIGSKLYLVGFDCKTNTFIAGLPCELCQPIIVNSKIERIITIQDNFNYIWNRPVL